MQFMDIVFEVEAHSADILCIEYSPLHNGTSFTQLYIISLHLVAVYACVYVVVCRSAVYVQCQSRQSDPCVYHSRPLPA